MSLCYRTFPNKFTSFVNARKQATKIDRHLPIHAKSSLFLRQFLVVKTTPAGEINIQKEMQKCILSQRKNFPLVTPTYRYEQSEFFRRNCNKCNARLLRVQLHKSIKGLNEYAFSYKILKNPNISNYTQYNTQLSKNHGLFENDNKESIVYYSKTDPIIIINNALMRCNYKNHILLSDSLLKTEKQNTDQPEKNSERQQEKLGLIYETLKNDLPQLFVKSLDYRIYTQDLLFINNIKGQTSRGLVWYVKTISFLRIVAHIKFAYVRMHILKMTAHPEDNTIKVRWRIVGIPGYKVVSSILTFKVWNIAERLKDAEAWHDGFSTFYVDMDGKVYKHVVDKVMPDEDTHKVEKAKPPVAPKLAVFSKLYNYHNCAFSSKKMSQLALLFFK